MKKEILKAVKALSRKENPLPPPKMEKNKKAYSRHTKHKTGYRNDSGLFFCESFPIF